MYTVVSTSCVLLADVMDRPANDALNVFFVKVLFCTPVPEYPKPNAAVAVNELLMTVLLMVEEVRYPLSSPLPVLLITRVLFAMRTSIA